MLLILSQMFGWIATVFRAGGMLAKRTSTVKLLVSVGNLGWLVSGMLTKNYPLIASNAICIIVMIFETVRHRRS